jgi:hypothetical protein
MGVSDVADRAAASAMPVMVKRCGVFMGRSPDKPGGADSAETRAFKFSLTLSFC